jgi:2-dehydropantoate 2-reductase
LKIAVIGAGAMGSLFAGYLAKSNLDVWAYDIWKEHIDAIQNGGLRMTRRQKAQQVRLKATSDPSEPGQADLVLIFVKYGHTRKALQNSLPMIGPDTLILTLQNGIGNIEILCELIPENRILFGLTTLTSELVGPGHIEESFQGRGETYFWPLGGKVTDAVKQVNALFNQAGIHTEISADVELRIWKKLIVNTCYNSLCAITHLKVGDLIDQNEAWPILKGVVSEIVEIAQKKGIKLNKNEALEFLQQVGEEARLHFPSMLVDVNHKRKTEIECLNGAVIREGKKLGIAARTNEVLYDLVQF